MLALHSCLTSFVIKWLLFLSRSLHHCGNQGRLQAEQCWMFLVPWDMVGDGFWTALRLVYLKQVRQLIIQSAWLRKKIVLSSTTLPSPFLVDPLWGEMALSKNSRLLHLMQCSPLFTEVINMLLHYPGNENTQSCQVEAALLMKYQNLVTKLKGNV